MRPSFACFIRISGGVHFLVRKKKIMRSRVVERCMCSLVDQILVGHIFVLWPCSPQFLQRMCGSCPWVRFFAGEMGGECGGKIVRSGCLVESCSCGIPFFKIG